jgi:hypothetical protein
MFKHVCLELSETVLRTHCIETDKRMLTPFLRHVLSIQTFSGYFLYFVVGETI